ncbi:type II toxin-antitoxin system RelE family toxin [Desulfomicrobium baculatum]|uniref:Addiction module toxin, RelE/StbE family n=1 Tax=Desulfomicrobium baculatum (strain DSM 4028 / VKM B-1378 / X) TaxID=525897 RepID=C7LQD8_DESBD|nr:type II toxin-antitoxin system RelE/ParE family toxin [Desulfomicrobium baculatum]ACU90340.1 addiction module toxin, RelE/StbE family [Desulfomicrobium baculatum DSM 4028]
MTYSLRFKEEAKKEWDRLDPVIREHFAKKLRQRRENPRVNSARLSGMPDCFKIKLRSAGYRLVYEVRDHEVVIVVIAVGKRERSAVYKIAAKRLG